MPPPWAADCPVKFEVWWKHGQVSPGEPADLILEVGEQQSVVRVFDYLGQFPAPLRAGGDRQPVLSGAYISVRLTFDELIAMVLPLMSMRRKIGSARESVYASGLAGAHDAPDHWRCVELVVPDSEAP